MSSMNTNAEIKATIEPAQELLSFGKTVHEVYGELSISFERMLTTTLVKTYPDGRRVERKEWPFKNSAEQLKFLEGTYLREGEKLMKMVYSNQTQNRNLIALLTLVILLGFTIWMIFA